MASEEVLEELEALTAILDEDTVEIEQDGASGRPTEITIQLRPLTASEQDKQYVSLALVVSQQCSALLRREHAVPPGAAAVRLPGRPARPRDPEPAGAGGERSGRAAGGHDSSMPGKQTQVNRPAKPN